MNANEGTITSLNQETLKLNGKDFPLKDIQEIITGNEAVQPNKNSRAFFTTTLGKFHVDQLKIEDADVFFSFGNNKNIFLPPNILTNITFIEPIKKKETSSDK